MSRRIADQAYGIAVLAYGADVLARCGGLAFADVIFMPRKDPIGFLGPGGDPFLSQL